MTPLLHFDDAPTRTRIRTTVGVPVGTRRYPALSPEACAAVRRKLELGEFLARFHAGFPVHLVGEIWVAGARSYLVAEDR